MTFRSSPSLAAAAMSYAANGWPVLPLHPRSKEPTTQRGLLQATDDPNQVEWWWRQNPDANIGLRTGVAFDALDIDGPEGLTTFGSAAPGYHHDGPVSATGKGFHLLFAVTGRPNFANPREGRTNGEPSPYPGLDYRGRSGYIVAPPSIHPAGHRYEWIRPAMSTLPPAPAWLLEMWPEMPVPRTTSVHSSGTLAAAVGSLDLADEFRQIGVDLRPAGGGRLRGRCPFHVDDTPSLVVYPGDRGFYCYGCSAWGDALNVRRYAQTGALR
jgi:hypothetical protein